MTINRRSILQGIAATLLAPFVGKVKASPPEQIRWVAVKIPDISGFYEYGDAPVVAEIQHERGLVSPETDWRAAYREMPRLTEAQFRAEYLGTFDPIDARHDWKHEIDRVDRYSAKHAGKVPAIAYPSRFE